MKPDALDTAVAGDAPRTLQQRLRVDQWFTPKWLITMLITLILVVGEWRYGITGGYEKLGITLGTCVLTEAVLSWFVLGKAPRLQSAYITGTSLTILLRPQDGLIWPFIVGSMLAIVTKYVLRYHGRHLWNPSNLGISLLILLAPAQVAVLSHELGNDLMGNAAIWFVGLLVVSRAKVLHVSLSYAGAFLVLAVLRSFLVGTPVLAEVAPITGPMYQLLCFFMLTDPPTSVSTKRGRIGVVILIAVVECLFRLANDFELPYAELVAPAPAILALFLVGPIFLVLDLRRRGVQA